MNSESNEEAMKADALLGHIKQLEKKLILLDAAAQELDNNPPSAEEMAGGAEQLDEGFLNRLEKRAEEAIEKGIREKWAKVLAAEIRKPGTFSVKVMRIIDEIEPQIAQLFQNLFQYRIGNAIPICLVGNLDGFDQRNLEAEGLLFSAELGFTKFYSSASVIRNGEKKESWAFAYAEHLLTFPKDTIIDNKNGQENAPLTTQQHDGIPTPSLDVYVLTPAGLAIASLFEDRQKDAFYAYLKQVSEFLPETVIGEHKAMQEDNKSAEQRWQLVQTWKNGAPIKN